MQTYVFHLVELYWIISEWMSLAEKFQLFRVIRSFLALHLSIVLSCVAHQLKEIGPRFSAWSAQFSQVQFLFLGSDAFNSCENLAFATIKRVSTSYDTALSLMSWTVSQEVCITACELWECETSTCTQTMWWMHLILNRSFCVTCRIFTIEIEDTEYIPVPNIFYFI